MKRVILYISISFISIFSYHQIIKHQLGMTKIYVKVLEIKDSEISMLKNKIMELQKFREENSKEVTVTMYNPVPEQTNSEPHITADGTHINVKKAHKYKYVAISRDLLHKNGGFLKFDDIIYIKGTVDKDGFYRVKDLMNKRIINTVDILETNKRKYKFENILITKIDPELFNFEILE